MISPYQVRHYVIYGMNDWFGKVRSFADHYPFDRIKKFHCSWIQTKYPLQWKNPSCRKCPQTIGTNLTKTRHTWRDVHNFSLSVTVPFTRCFGLLVRAKSCQNTWKLVFFHIYKVFWLFLYDFDLLNQNPLSARCESLRNFVQTQKPKMAAKSQNPFK